YCQRDGVLPQRRHPPLRAAEARVLSWLVRLGLRKAADEKADPRRLAAVGAAVRARLAQDPRTQPRGGRAADLFTVPAFASPAECAALLALIERGAQPSPLFNDGRSEEHTSELQSRENLVCRLLLEKKKKHSKH